MSYILINLFFINFSFNLFSHIKKCLKIHQLGLSKVTTKKKTQKRLVKDIKVFPKEKRKAKMWSRTAEGKKIL